MSQFPPEKPIPPKDNFDSNPYKNQFNNPYSGPSHVPAHYGQPQPSNTAGTVGFVLSLLGLFGIGCVITSLAGTIVSFVGSKNEPKGLATAGLVLGIIGMVLWTGIIIVYVLIVSFMVAAVGSLAAASANLFNYMPLYEANQTIVREWNGDGLPDEIEGNELIKGKKDTWNNQIRYDVDDNGYTLRSAGEDRELYNNDDFTIGPFRSIKEARKFDPEDMIERQLEELGDDWPETAPFENDAKPIEQPKTNSESEQ